MKVEFDFNRKLGGGNWQLKCSLFSPRKLGEDEPIFDEHVFFQLGWFNHQLVNFPIGKKNNRHCGTSSSVSENPRNAIVRMIGARLAAPSTCLVRMGFPPKETPSLNDP